MPRTVSAGSRYRIARQLWRWWRILYGFVPHGCLRAPSTNLFLNKFINAIHKDFRLSMSHLICWFQRGLSSSSMLPIQFNLSSYLRILSTLYPWLRISLIGRRMVMFSFLYWNFKRACKNIWLGFASRLIFPSVTIPWTSLSHKNGVFYII